MQTVHAILPLKDLVDAKTRLTGVLRPAERRALAQAMVEDVLRTVTSHPALSSLVLLSDDSSAALLAQQYGAAHCPERALGVRGLNPLLEACRHHRLPGDGLTLILHGDIPLLSAADLDAALDLAAPDRLIIGCDRHGVGTNLLLAPSATPPRLAFGADSCARHAAAAEATGLQWTILERDGLGLDVDEPADLLMLCRALSDANETGRTATWLRASGIVRRLEAMMGSQTSAISDLNTLVEGR
ncbi:MAG: 2-phospho-L-lactate guanylyltransferase [Pseudomonadota bacterium]